ncbi:hypothetical protein C8J57DRAFT_1494271 [Mycena rebaudengoi]|nr:hypothetical protein C8J57DRAFT_1494271 [Mycena rebaudengoi]
MSWGAHATKKYQRTCPPHFGLLGHPLLHSSTPTAFREVLSTHALPPVRTRKVPTTPPLPNAYVPPHPSHTRRPPPEIAEDNCSQRPVRARWACPAHVPASPACAPAPTACTPAVAPTTTSYPHLAPSFTAAAAPAQAPMPAARLRRNKPWPPLHLVHFCNPRCLCTPPRATFQPRIISARLFASIVHYFHHHLKARLSYSPPSMEPHPWPLAIRYQPPRAVSSRNDPFLSESSSHNHKCTLGYIPSISSLSTSLSVKNCASCVLFRHRQLLAPLLCSWLGQTPYHPVDALGRYLKHAPRRNFGPASSAVLPIACQSSAAVASVVAARFAVVGRHPRSHVV